jgi:hypothetical protein
MVLVFPGLPEVFASFEYPVNRLISDDFPTFERPIKANSGFTGSGHCVKVTLLPMNEAERMIIRHLFYFRSL